LLRREHTVSALRRRLVRSPREGLVRIAITGGTGTLGRSLISRCLTRGAERVVSLSRDEVKAGELVRDFGDPPALRVFLGNVLASRGGVLEVWRRALRYGKPLPLTHPDMTRFVLSSTEAARFVTACLERMRGGEVFVPDLPAMRLVDLAEALAPGHPTETVGLRPGGEKIHEVLLSDEEMTRLRRSERGGPLFVTPSHRSWSAIPYDGVEATVAEYRSDRVTRLSVKELRDRCTAGLFTALRRWCGSDELREGSS